MEPSLGASITAEVSLAPEAAFDQLVDEIVEAFARLGLRFEPGPDGIVQSGSTVVGRVQAWRPGQQLLLDWRPAPWDPQQRVEVEVRVEPAGTGARIVVEHRGLAKAITNNPVEWTGWVSTALVAPFLAAITPGVLGDWLTDRAARRPSGPGARTIYSDPLFHRPNFRLLMDTLHPGPTDRVLEVGCGGGALLQDILRQGSRGVGVDHSPEMVRLAQKTNRAAVREGRLEVLEAEGSRLPVPDQAFTIALSTGVFGFLPRPLETLREMHRALAPGGRLAVFAGTKDLVGTPACPEPIASRIHFYEDDELENLARKAGFAEVAVSHPSLHRYAVEVGVPAEALSMFEGTTGSQLLLARREGALPAERGGATAPKTPKVSKAAVRPTRPPARAARKTSPGGRARR